MVRQAHHLTTLSQVEGQITKTDPPQADQTDDPLAFVPNGIITGGLKIWAAIRYDRVECFGHWILKFEIYLAQF